jgi:hypothetical protein
MQKIFQVCLLFFHLTNGLDIPAADESGFSIFSTYVFQYFDSLSFVEGYFAKIARIMQLNDTCMIHLPVYEWTSNPKIFSMLYAAQKAVSGLLASAQRMLMQYGLAKPLMQRISCPLSFFYNVLPKYGFYEIELSVFVVKSNNDPHPFIFARKKSHAL